jgi:N-acyl-D-amino-acid deacylase
MLLRGGLVADGIGPVVVRADVLIEGPVIAWIGPDGETAGASPESCEVIELAPGSVVCPGFIDAHVHAEGPLLETGYVEGALAQGVTTLVAGQDGESWIGASAATGRYLDRYFGPVNGSAVPARDLSVSGYREAVAGRLAQNVAVLASQGTIRHNVAGMAAGPLDAEQRAAARRAVQDALAEGAVGLSSGLDYLPSRFAGVDEIADLAVPLAGAGRPYVSHLRGYGPAVGAGLEELVAVGRAAGVRVHASHLWGAPDAIEPVFGAAGSAGVPVTFDMYPYRKSSTILAVLLLPPEWQTGGPDQTLAALRDPRQRAVLLADESFSGQSLRNLYLGSLPSQYGRFAGLSVAEAAAASSSPAGEWVLDLLFDAELNVGAHLDRPELTEEHLAGQYLAGDHDTGYQQIARHLAANAADVYGLRTRGRLAPSMAADLCVISPDGITDHAIYGAPQMHATGVDMVIVNGVVAWRNGAPAPGRPGEFVSS